MGKQVVQQGHRFCSDMTSRHACRRRSTSRHRQFALVVASLLASAGCTSRQASAEELDRIVDILQLQPGSVVADVGAGEGEWAVELAKRVGAAGHVWATEVDKHDVEDLEERLLDGSRNNVTVVLGDQFETGLPAECCDAILLRMVYHHFTNPARMRSSLRQSLRPGGLIAIIDITPQSAWRDLPDVPERGGHGIERGDLIREMTSAGFTVVLDEDDWNGDDERYCVVFRR
jgi:SAM-dependent methyltransferase